MKNSKRNIASARIRAEKRAEGPPTISKYAAKYGRGPVNTSLPDDYKKRLAEMGNG